MIKMILEPPRFFRIVRLVTELADNLEGLREE